MNILPKRSIAQSHFHRSHTQNEKGRQKNVIRTKGQKTEILLQHHSTTKGNELSELTHKCYLGSNQLDEIC